VILVSRKPSVSPSSTSHVASRYISDLNPGPHIPFFAILLFSVSCYLTHPKARGMRGLGRSTFLNTPVPNLPMLLGHVRRRSGQCGCWSRGVGFNHNSAMMELDATQTPQKKFARGSSPSFSTKRTHRAAFSSSRRRPAASYLGRSILQVLDRHAVV
jgi:hypothetical protein